MKTRQGDISAQDRHTASARFDRATRLGTTIQRRGRWSAGRGQIAVLFALTLVILVGVMMLSIDLSRVRAQTENAQRAANAAALAGVVFLPNFTDKADSRAIGEAVKNGFQNGANGVSVTTAIPDGNTNRLKVTITTPVSLVFGGILGLGRVTVSRSATAEFAEPLEMGAPDYVLGYPAFPTAMVPGGTSTQGFYLEARGPYGQQENGDAYSQYFESYNNGGLYPNPVSNFENNLTNPCVPNTGVPNTPGTLYPVDCRDIVTLGPTAQLGGPLKVNPDRQKYGVDGYDFVIDKPEASGTTPLVVKLFDPYDEGPLENSDAKFKYKPAGQLIVAPYNNEYTDQDGCYAGNTSFCNQKVPVALQFTLQGPYQTTYDTSLKPVIGWPSGVQNGKCPAEGNGNCVLTNDTISSSFTAGDDPTYEACASTNCAGLTNQSPYAYKFLNYAIITQPGLYRLHVKSVVNVSGKYATLFGTGGNNFAIAACGVTDPSQEVLGSAADPSAGKAATANPVQTSVVSDTTAVAPTDIGSAWNAASCLNPNSITDSAGNPTWAATSCPNPTTAPSGSCVHIYAVNRMCIYNNLAGNGSTALVPLGYVPAAYAGKRLHIRLYDVGDVSNSSTTSVQVLTPAGSNTDITGTVGGGYPVATDYSWWVAPTDCPNPSSSGACSSGGSGYITDGSEANPHTAQHNVSGAAGTAIGGLGSDTHRYNGSWLTIDTTIPSDNAPPSYTTMVNKCGGYWKMRYNIPAGGSGNDTTTWEISVAGAPVHLVQ